MKKHTSAGISPERILDHLKKPSYTPLKRSELFQRMGLAQNLRQPFKKMLRRMLEEGQILKVRKNRYAVAKTLGMVLGTFRANESGFGFVVADDAKTADVFIPRHATSRAMNSDKVLVRLDDPASQNDPSKGPSGSIVRIVERGNSIIVGALASSKSFFFVIPDDPRIVQDVYVAKQGLQGATVGDRVVVRITEWPSKHVNPEGVVEEVLGRSDDPNVDLIATLRKYNLQREFPDKVQKEAKAIPETIPPDWLTGRVDYRDKDTVTIDPDDAKDFDDAISLEETRSGYKLAVHIADVSFYVKEGSALDQEARGRATSVYLPSCVVPMLPERLSNGVCSLRQGEDRLTKTVLFHCSAKGDIQRTEVFPSVIRSNKRFTYGEVLKIISADNPAVAPEIRPLVPMLKNMAALAGHLHEVRVRRGSIMLEIPKVKVRLDKQYRPVGVLREESDEAHSLIEEFMLLANEAVARTLCNAGQPGIFRVHEPPDKEGLEEFAVFVRSLGYNMHTQDVSVHEIQRVLKKIEGIPEQTIIHLHLLRALKLACYRAENLGHFALALKFYAHFTSPIRRYPDMIVHRILDAMWARSKTRTGAGSRLLSKEEVAGIATHSSKMERQADEAERGLSTVKILQFMSELASKNSRRVHEGMITRIKSFGFFVELEETLVPGLVHLSGLRDDFYDVDINKQSVRGRRRRRTFKLGQRVRVRIHKVDLAKRQVDLIVV